MTGARARRVSPGVDGGARAGETAVGVVARLKRDDPGACELAGVPRRGREAHPLQFFFATTLSDDEGAIKHMRDERGDAVEEAGVRRAGESRVGGTARKVAIYLAAAFAVFLLGLVPMWLRAREHAAQRDAARRELRLSRMQNALSSAAVDSARGDYEPARQSASDFFTALREEADVAGGGSALTPQQRESLRPLLAQRDDLITLLARSDPAATGRLLDTHAAFRKAALAAPPGDGQSQQQK